MLRHSDGVLQSTMWEVTVRISFDVSLRRAFGGGEELHQAAKGRG